MEKGGKDVHYQESSTMPFSVFGFDIPGLQLTPGNWKNDEGGDIFSTDFPAATTVLKGDELLSPEFSMQAQYANVPVTHAIPHSSAIPIASSNSRYTTMGPSFNRSSNRSVLARFPISTSVGGGSFVQAPGAPMPSPINYNHPVGVQEMMVPFHLYGHSQPTDETFSPRSPPMEHAHLNVMVNKGPIVAASPRSLNEGMFSFRANSLSTMEQQVEKQRKRKENHNLVERRRRDLINIMISRLALLVSAGSTGLDQVAANKMNKGEVLESSVRRILLLNQMTTELAQQLLMLDPNNQILSNYAGILSSLVTVLPESEAVSLDSKSPSLNSFDQ